MLNDKDLTILNDKLYVPGEVRELMAHAAVVDPDTRFRLHEIISNFQPDSALICIALTAREITEFQGYPTMAIDTLRYHCDRIIEEYGTVWLEHAHNQKIDDNLLFETLAQIPEDLADMAELLEVNANALRMTDDKAADLLDILKIQAGAHAIIAEEFVDMLESTQEQPLVITAPIFTNNVIPFPLTSVIRI